ncbi:MAG: hypothetical protein D6710_01905 [Nitrospirae bacterium]|nr:MAG: hypothetical protein D6710_01905 [Nitrospirota bacterium]
MSLRWIEGFETLYSAEDVQKKYLYADGIPSDTGQFLGSGKDFGLAYTSDVELITKRIVNGTQRFAFGCHFMVEPGTQTGVAEYVFKPYAFYSGGVDNVSDQKIELAGLLVYTKNAPGIPDAVTIPDNHYRFGWYDGFSNTNSSAFAHTFSGYYQYGQWYFVEFFVLLNPSNAGFIEAKVDGTTVLSATGQTSLLGGTSVIGFTDAIGIKNLSAASGSRMDNIYFVDNLGDEPFNNMLGEVKIEGITVSGDGQLSEWSPVGAQSGYQAVSGQYDSDQTYISTDVSAESVFTMTDLQNIPDGTILGAQMNVTIKHSNISTPAQIRGSFRKGVDGGFTGPVPVTRNTAFDVPAVGYTTIGIPIDFALTGTGSLWTTDDINSGEFGIFREI